MSLSLEALVRHEVGKLLRDERPEQFLCLPRLSKRLRQAPGVAYTKGRVERALLTAARIPEVLTYKHAFVRDQCGKTTACLSAK